MPNLRSAKKRLRQGAKRQAHNKSLKSKARTAVKKFQEELEAGNVENARKLMQAAFSQLDKNSKRNLVNKNHVARRKSSLASALNKVAATKN
ncbi:MAG: 30S ribosomal protein S20 [Planctomycetes bacterium]|nr:30S ribosomal protein S20 [Planctomycetota bacterium]